MINKLKFLYRAYRYKYLIDTPEIKYLIANLSSGDIGVDIGSHKGGYLYWFRNRVGKTGKVYAFEPQTKLYRYLTQVVSWFGYENVIVENKGISSEIGKINFYIPPTNSGSSPGARIDFEEKETIVDSTNIIEITTLDKYFLENEIIPQLIKIDVEGHEKNVILGGVELLKKYHPRIILECENRHLIDYNIFSVFDLLTEIGYQGFFFDGAKMNSITEFDLDKNQKVGEGRFWEEKGYINNFIFQKENTI